MTQAKESLRTGFHRLWRPRDGNFTEIDRLRNEDQYTDFDHFSTVLHFSDALECLKCKQLLGHTFNEFSVLENSNCRLIRFFCKNYCDSDSCLSRQNKSLLGKINHDDHVFGNVMFTIQGSQIFRSKRSQQNFYFVEVIDLDDCSIARCLLTSRQYDNLPKIDLHTKGFPLYQTDKKLFCLKQHNNYEGKTVKYFVELIVEEDCFDSSNFWELLHISTIRHEGDKRFRCKRVLDRTLSMCVTLQKEDSLAGILVWMLLNDRLDLHDKFSLSSKQRIVAIHDKIQKEHPCSSSEGDSEMSISDVEFECESSICSTVSSTSSEYNTDSELNAVCDYIAYNFYSSVSHVDIRSLQQALAKCDTNEPFPTESEIRACLVLILKWIKDPVLLDERNVLLNMIPCDKFLTQKYQSLAPCADVMCAHDNFKYCPDVERKCYGYILFSLNRWRREDSMSSF